MYRCLLEAFKDWTWRGKRSTHRVWESIKHNNRLVGPQRFDLLHASIPSFISLESWSCANRGPISPATVRFMIVSTSTRSLLSRKLKSPNQKTWSNLVVTSATITNDVFWLWKELKECYIFEKEEQTNCSMLVFFSSACRNNILIDFSHLSHKAA